MNLLPDYERFNEGEERPKQLFGDEKLHKTISDNVELIQLAISLGILIILHLIFH
jgi:hypothetical protein